MRWRGRMHFSRAWFRSDFDTSYRNLMSNQRLMGWQKVVGTTDAEFGWFVLFTTVYGLGERAVE